MATSDQIRACENEVALIRRNIADLQYDRDELRRRIEGLRGAIREMEDRPQPGFRRRVGELQALIEATKKEREARRIELEMFREQLHGREQACWNLRREMGQRQPNEHELRKTIDDPRYWRDGDPALALAQIVSDGFKRLYPDDPET